MKAAVIIPAYNEEKSIRHVLQDIPRNRIDEIIVVDNASSDGTTRVASEMQVTVLNEPRRGYGSACLRGIAYLDSLAEKPDVVVFVDGDYSDHPQLMAEMLDKLNAENADLIIGNRVKSMREPGAMTFPQRFGNALATRLIKWFYGYRYKDLGPFRAIRYDALKKINMLDTNYGWTVEMQIKALKHNLHITQMDVPYRKRIGISKISGTLRGSVSAGYKIITTIFKYR